MRPVHPIVKIAPAPDAPGRPPVAAQADSRPNFIVVVTDDMRDSDWQALPKTRALLEATGTTFPNFLLTTPVCSPSRVSLLTGMYAHHHGVTRNDGRKGGHRAFSRRNLGRATISAALRAEGYRTGLFGKFLNGTGMKSGIPGGWDSWLVDTSRSYRRPEMNANGKPKAYKKKSSYSTDILAGAARNFLMNVPANSSFLLWFTPRAPHGKLQPRRKDRKLYRSARRQRSPDVWEADVSDKPRDIWKRKAPRLAKLNALEQKRLRMLAATDDAVASLLATAQAAGRLANTVVFVLSDNGYMLGSHRCEGKGFPYRGATQVTMLAAGGPFAAGATDLRLAANIDIAPTIAALAGVELPDADGISLLDRTVNSEILIENTHGGRSYAGLRTVDWLYVENTSGERELYDYRRDPYELDNLLAAWNGHTPAADAVALAANFKTRLAHLRHCAAEACH